MAVWGVAEAKAQFSAVLDQAEAEGPQLVKRRKQEFYVVTKEQMVPTPPAAEEKQFMSGWDALRPPSGEFFDVNFSAIEEQSPSD